MAEELPLLQRHSRVCRHLIINENENENENEKSVESVKSDVKNKSRQMTQKKNPLNPSNPMLIIKTTEDTKVRKSHSDLSFCENLCLPLLKIKNNRKRRGFFVVSLFYCIFAAS